MVCDLFERAARGEGIRTSVHALNTTRVPPPTAGKRGTGSWSPSVVYRMLHNTRYLGVQEWGHMRKGYKGGRKIRSEQPPSEVLQTRQEGLRIISDELWARVRAQDPAPRTVLGGGLKRAPARYLLTGHARCGLCDGPMQVSRAKMGKVNVPAYTCGWSRDRGGTVCTNKLRRPVEELDDAVVGWVQGHVLNDEVLAEVLKLARRQYEDLSDRPDTERERLEAELARTRAEIERLGDAITHAEGASDVLVRRLVEREVRVKDLGAQLVAKGQAKVVVKRWVDVEQKAWERLHELGALLKASGEGARKVLAALLERPLKCAPEVIERSRRYRITGEMVIPLGVDFLAGESWAETVRMKPSPEGTLQSDTARNAGVSRLSAVADIRHAA